MEQAFDWRARLIDMVQPLSQEQPLEEEYCWAKRPGCLLYPVRYRSLGQPTFQQIHEDLANALHRQQLILGEIDRQGLYSGSILGRRTHSTRKAAGVLMLTHRTGEDFHLMFRDNQ